MTVFERGHERGTVFESRLVAYVAVVVVTMSEFMHLVLVLRLS